MATELRLLIVEDSEVDALLLLRELQKCGYAPEWQRVGTPEAMKSALTAKRWDVVVSDFRMPRFSALDALQMVKESGMDIPFIIVSGIIGEETAVEAMRSGARDCISKGNLARLAPAIKREMGEAEVRRKNRQAESALQESEERYRLLLESVTDYIYTTLVEDGMPVATSHGHGCVAVTGYTEDEYDADPGLWLLMVHEEDRAAVLEQAAAVLAGKAFSPLEHRIIHKDGRICWIRNTPVPRRDLVGTLIAFDGIVTDITARKQAELKTIRLNRTYTVLSKFNEAIVRIREPESLFRELCRIFVEDGLFRMAWMGIVNQDTLAVKPVVHYGHEEGYLDNIHISLDPELPEGRGPIGTSLRERRVLVNNDTKNNPFMSPWHEAAIQRGYLSSATFPILLEDTLFGAFTMYSEEINFFDQDEISLLSSLSDDLSYAVESMKNEAERRVVNNALKREKEFLRNLLQGSAIATFVLDQRHRVLLWNHACEELTGVKSEDVTGTTLHWRAFYDYERPCLADIIIDECMEHLPRLYAHTSRSTLTPEGLQAEGRFPDLNGMDRYIMFNAAPIRNGEGMLLGAIETLQDISGQKKIEAQLFQAQKMEAIGQLAGGIAHDFNNILTVIIGFCTLVDMDMDVDDPHKANLSNVLAAADRAADLTRSLLTFSRKQDINPQQVDLNQIIGKTDKFLKRIIGEDIELSTSFGQEIVTVNADAGQIEQVLMNLATNARDAMPDGGRLSIETGLFEADDDYIKANGCGEPGWYACISVSDSGEGMEEATCKRIFEPFFTTKEVGKGTGLGLSVVFGIIKQHHGLINVYSEPGRGTTFRILLPLIQATVSENPVNDEEKVENGVGTILVADDDASIRDLTGKILTMFGYTVIIAVDGKDALARFNENRERIDLVILDIIMPEMNGKEAFDRMKTINPAIRGIFISGYTSDIIQKRGLLEQGIDFVAKPLNIKQLLIKVRDVLRREA